MIVTSMIFAVLGFFIPVVGIVLALFSSIFALAGYRKDPVLANIVFAVNSINTLFFSPVLFGLGGLVTAYMVSQEAYIPVVSNPLMGYGLVLTVHALLWVLAITRNSGPKKTAFKSKEVTQKAEEAS